MFPSSFGLSFCVDGAATALRVTAAWGRYQRVKSEQLTSERTGEPLLVWRREPMGGQPRTIPLAEGPLAAFAPDPEQEAVSVRGGPQPAEVHAHMTNLIQRGVLARVS